MKSRNLFGSILVICGCYLYGLHTCEGFSLIRNSNPSSIHNVYNNFASQSSNRNDGARILSHLSGRGKLSALNMSKRSNEVQQALELIQELLQLADDAKGNPDMEKEVEKMLRAASAALDEAEKKELINKGPDRSDFISPLEMKQVAKDNYSRFSWAQGGANKPQQLRDGGDMPVQPRRWKDKYAGMKNRFQESRRLQNQARNDGIYMLPEASRRDINSDGAQVFPPPNDRESPRYLELREAQRQNELNLKQDRDRSSFQQQMGQTKQSESSVEGTSNMIRQNTYLSSDEKSSLDRPITTKPPSYLDKDSQFTSDNDASSYVSSPSPSNTNQSKPMPKWKQQTDQEKDKDDTAAADAMVGTTSYLQGFSKPPATANKEVSKPVPKWKKEASSPASAPASKGIGSFLNVFGGGSSSSTSSDSAKAFEQEEKKAKEKGQQTSPSATAPDTMASSGSYLDAFNKAPSPVSGSGVPAKPVPKWKQQTNQEKDKNDTAAADTMVGATSYLQGFSKSPSTANKTVSKPVPKWKKEASSPSSSPALGGAGSFLNAFGGGSSSSTSSDSAKAFEKAEKAKEQISPSATSSGENNKASTPAKPVPKWKEQTDKKKDKDDASAADAMVGATSYLQGFSKPPSGTNKAASKPVPIWKKEESSLASASAFDGANAFVDADSSPPTSSDISSEIAKGFMKRKAQGQTVSQSPSISDPNTMDGSDSYRGQFNKALTSTGGPPVMTSDERISNAKSSKDNEKSSGLFGSFLDAFNKSPTVSNDSSDDIVRKSSKNVYEPSPSTKSESANDPEKSPSTNMQQANQATFRQVRDSKVKPKLDDPVQLREDSISESSEDDYGVEVFEMIQEIQEEAMLAAIGGIFVGLAPGLLYASYLYMNEFSLDVNTDVLPFIPAGSAAFFSLLSYRLSIPFGKTKSNDPLDYDTDFAMTIRLFLAAPFARIKLVLSGKYEKYRVIADVSICICPYCFISPLTFLYLHLDLSGENEKSESRN